MAGGYPNPASGTNWLAAEIAGLRGQIAALQARSSLGTGLGSKTATSTLSVPTSPNPTPWLSDADAELTVTSNTGRLLVLVVAAVRYGAAVVRVDFSATGAATRSPTEQTAATDYSQAPDEFTTLVAAGSLVGEPGEVTVTPCYQAEFLDVASGVSWGQILTRTLVVLPT
ncbi:MAG: hypothetical protein QM621_14950 [Aeromicrobium sp.]|uniref:hypothetical protein n=1 Tax=Aeromicrobium sp. TaxID=1871063 RepID=UPI0039E45010